MVAKKSNLRGSIATTISPKGIITLPFNKLSGLPASIHTVYIAIENEPFSNTLIGSTDLTHAKTWKKTYTTYKPNQDGAIKLNAKHIQHLENQKNSTSSTPPSANMTFTTSKPGIEFLITETGNLSTIKEEIKEQINREKEKEEPNKRRPPPFNII